jgi:hypothetical protein
MPSLFPAATIGTASSYLPQVLGWFDFASRLGLAIWYGGLVHLTWPLLVRACQHHTTQCGMRVSGASA